MGLEVKSFEVYGFKIEVHAGGRRVWPPSFKRFINDKLDCGELSVGQVRRKCNVSRSLIYKWRADVRRARSKRTITTEERVFSEVVVEEDAAEPAVPSAENIMVRVRDIELTLPVAYPIEQLISLVQSIEART